jgi:hypothetical protein
MLFFPDCSTAVRGAPRLVAGAPRCSQVHLKATASVQSTLGFDHPGILVRQLPNTPSDKNTFADVFGISFGTVSVAVFVFGIDQAHFTYHLSPVHLQVYWAFVTYLVHLSSPIAEYACWLSPGYACCFFSTFAR